MVKRGKGSDQGNHEGMFSGKDILSQDSPGPLLVSHFLLLGEAVHHDSQLDPAIDDRIGNGRGDIESTTVSEEAHVAV